MNDVQSVGLNPEDEAMFDRFRSMLDNVRNTLINASQLAGEVVALREQVAAMNRDIEHIRQANATLDEALQNTRRERDEAKNDNEALRFSLKSAQDDAGYAFRLAEERAGKIAELDKHVTVLRERNDATELELIYSQDRIEVLTAMVNASRQAVGLEALPAWEAPKALPEATTQPMVQSDPQPVQEPEKPKYEDQRQDYPYTDRGLGQDGGHW